MIQNVCVVTLAVVFFSVMVRFFVVSWNQTDELPKLRQLSEVTLKTTELIKMSTFYQVVRFEDSSPVGWYAV
jgi:uncharacterized protein YggT (Ycf19 family)